MFRVTIVSVIVQMNGSERLPTFLTPLIFSIWYFTRFSFVPFAPKFIFSGLLISSGYHLLFTWMILPFYRIPFMEWLVIISIVVFFQLFGMLTGKIRKELSINNNIFLFI